MRCQQHVPSKNWPSDPRGYNYHMDLLEFEFLWTPYDSCDRMAFFDRLLNHLKSRRSRGAANYQLRKEQLCGRHGERWRSKTTDRVTTQRTRHQALSGNAKVVGKRLWTCSKPGGWKTPIWNRRGCSSEILNSTPKGDQSGRGSSFLCPLKDIKNTKCIIYFSLFLRVQPY